MRLSALVFGVFCYLLFLIAFLYQIGFLAGIFVPKTINDGEVMPALQAAAIDVFLLSLFAIQHTIMARLVFKRWWTTKIPAAIERSIFVLASSLLLLLMNWQWRPLPDVIWQIDNSLMRAIIFAIAAAGWGLVLYSTMLIDHLDLFGLRQVWLFYLGRKYTPVEFRESVIYRWLRHPLMLGFVIAFWATPDMTVGHLLFAVVTTAYILFGIQIEEKTLLALHGDDYREYRKRVSMIVPRPPRWG